MATHDGDRRRTVDVRAAMWQDERVRAVGLPDPLTAAVAERERVTAPPLRR